MAEPAAILPASSILLLRDGQTALEVFMVVRHHQIDFASGALVFPGGKVDPEDSDAELLQRLDGATPGHEHFQVAAIREAWEESGVLLARATGESDLLSGERIATLSEHRAALNAGSLSFIDFARVQDLRLAADTLVPYAHWVTPEMMPKRFDTWFYLTRAPAEHLAVHDGGESVDSVWISASDVTADAAAGRRTVIFPTLRNVSKLLPSANVEDALARAAREPIVEVLPWVEQRADGNWLCITPEAGYDVSEERLPERSARPAGT